MKNGLESDQLGTRSLIQENAMLSFIFWKNEDRKPAFTKDLICAQTLC